jgi:hypothetical protein
MIAPLWTRALQDRERERRRRLRTRVAQINRGARARMALVTALRQVGVDVDLVTVHTWPRSLQGEAYLWAISRLTGLRFAEAEPPPMGLAKVLTASNRGA